MTTEPDPHAGASFVCPDRTVTDGIADIRAEVGVISFTIKAAAKEVKRLADATVAQNNRVGKLEHQAIAHGAVIGILKWLIPITLTGAIGVAGITVGILELALK